MLKQSTLKIYTYFSMLLCRILYDIVYMEIFPSKVASERYCANITIQSYIISWLVFLPFIPVICKLNNRANKMSEHVMLFLFLLSYIPFTTLVGCGFIDDGLYIFSYFAMWICLVSFCRICWKVKPIFSNSFRWKTSKVILLLVMYIEMAVIVFISWKYCHLKVSFNLMKVYEYRFIARGFSIPVIIKYIRTMATIVLMLLLSYALYSKRRTLSLMISMVQILNYGIDGSKMYLFILGVGIGSYYLYEKFFCRKFIQYLNVLLAMSIVEFFWQKTYFIAYFIFGRLSFLPNYLGFCYFDYFTRKGADYFAQSFLRHFGVVSKYSQAIPFIIGDIYRSGALEYANSGFFADAITNFSYAGIILYPLTLTFLFFLLDNVSCNIPVKIYLVVAIYMAIQIQNSFITICLITHGFIAVYLILFIISQEILRDNKHNMLEQA